ncbi:hypothetical protein [Bacillus tuaregi]|uniref:hypothetical protein n=1 Tax=Bacillus tuaregi TaxID=1816695 RepID=UPI0008F9634C|nr:hypothetical protein [Bacillus tuaregi]
MLVEINLLPKKDTRNKNILILALIFILLIVAALSFYIWQINAKEKELADIQTQLTMTLDLVEAKNKQITDYQSSTSVQQLEQAISWAETQPFDAVFLVDELTRILPERGYFTEFDMDGNHKIKQKIRFDTKSEAAYYLHSLLAFDWVDEAVLSEAKSEAALDEEEDEEGENKSVGLVNEDNVLPRYIAQYEMIVNIPNLTRAALEAEKKKEEGAEDTEEGDDQ